MKTPAASPVQPEEGRTGYLRGWEFMNRIPLDLDLSYLVGRQVTFIGLDQFNLYLTLSGEITNRTPGTAGQADSVVLDSDVKICISGGWSLVDSSGQVIDECVEHVARKSYQIHVMLGLRLVNFKVVSETALLLLFEKGYYMTLDDDNDHYESFTIEFNRMQIIV